MKRAELLDANTWAEQTFGRVELHDARRTKRAVQVAAALAEDPAGSLPVQMQRWKAVKATYRFLNEEEVTFKAMIAPHLQHSRELAEEQAVVLLVQDTTDIDLSHRHGISGVGQIGNERGRGFFVQTVLAICPDTREVLGCVAQEPFVRVPAPAGEQRHERLKRPQRETDVWMRQVERIGTPSPQSQWVHVGDRGADMFPFFAACQATGTRFLVRACQNRRVEVEEEELSYAVTQMRSWLTQDSRPFEVPARHGHAARSTTVQLAFGPMRLLPPRNDARGATEPIPIWGIRVWEEHAPDGEEPLEWLLLTTVPTQSVQEAWQRAEWYRCRWLVEDYHQCLKSGCRIEHRQLQSVERLIRLLGVLSPLAVRLLQVRAMARQEPDRPAQEVIDPLLLAVLATQCQRDPATLTLGTFWSEVARLGGYLARRRDGPPGWRTIWKGWMKLHSWVEGVQLAARLPS